LEKIEEIFSKNLKRERERMGFKNQLALAERVGVGKRSVQAWEQGINLPELAILTALGDALELHPSELFMTQELANKALKGPDQLAPIYSFIRDASPSQLETLVRIVNGLRGINSR